jgi:signal recognition particle subunit SRP54
MEMPTILILGLTEVELFTYDKSLNGGSKQMFDQLSDRLQKVMKFLRGEGKVTEKNMAEALKMIRLALLEADVNYKVVKDFEQKIKVKALNQEVLDSLMPAQHSISY